MGHCFPVPDLGKRKASRSADDKPRKAARELDISRGRFASMQVHVILAGWQFISSAKGDSKDSGMMREIRIVGIHPSTS